MNKYIFIRRLTGPAILLLLGIVALLHQAHLVHFGIFVPLLLILLGVLKLAERAALAAEPYPVVPYPYPYSGTTGVPPTPGTMGAAPPQSEPGRDHEGGLL